ncbi:hypothetical protein M0R04_02925 [Candidatus Dojkabacteria bacterium]|jgi:hypothetical protein|nr:hypothetical protein [Candidatus Dojkabacteria bacterium]
MGIYKLSNINMTTVAGTPFPGDPQEGLTSQDLAQPKQPTVYDLDFMKKPDDQLTGELIRIKGLVTEFPKAFLVMNFGEHWMLISKAKTVPIWPNSSDRKPGNVLITNKGFGLIRFSPGLLIGGGNTSTEIVHPFNSVEIAQTLESELAKLQKDVSENSVIGKMEISFKRTQLGGTPFSNTCIIEPLTFAGDGEMMIRNACSESEKLEKAEAATYLL